MRRKEKKSSEKGSFPQQRGVLSFGTRKKEEE
jgi:hypothetical protein